MKRIISAVFVVLLALSFFACSKKTTVQDVCEKLYEGDEDAESVEELGEELQECTNMDEVLACMGQAETENAAEACFATCQRAEAE